jgi:hypothetical protein
LKYQLIDSRTEILTTTNLETATMAPANKSTSIFLALNGSTIDGAYATVEAATARVAELGASAEVQEHDLKGGNITVVEEKVPKAKAAKKEVEGDEEAAPVKKKTKTPVRILDWMMTSKASTC